MPTSDHCNTVHQSSRWYQLSLGDFLKACSTALVPLMIGVMTLVTTLQQNKLANDNRRQDLYIAQATRQDLILSTYLNEMSRLLIDFNFNLSKQVRSIVVRPKTLTALHQLNPQRKVLLLEYLYESNLIRSRHYIFEQYTTDLREADLKQIDLNPKEFDRRPLTYLSLVGTHLNEAKFDQCQLNGADFELAQMAKASFRGSLLENVNFFRTSLINTDFTDAIISRSDLTYANLTGSNITDEQLASTLTYHRAILPNGTHALYMNLLQNGDAQHCTLEQWHSDENGTIQIRTKDRNCQFAANRSKGEVTMSQKIDYYKMQASRSKAYYMEVRIDIEKIRPSNETSRVKLTKLFLDQNGYPCAQGTIVLLTFLHITLSSNLDEYDINTTDLILGQIQTKSWIDEYWNELQGSYLD